MNRHRPTASLDALSTSLFSPSPSDSSRVGSSSPLERVNYWRANRRLTRARAKAVCRAANEASSVTDMARAC